MRRALFVLAAVAVTSAAALPAHAGAVERHRYVANDSSGLALGAVSQSTGVAVDGTVFFKATSDHVVVTIADRVARRTVPLIIYTTDGRRVQCVRVGRATRVEGLVTGEWTAFSFLGPEYRDACRGGATVGIMTIQL